jgi:hypothetical protein
VLHQFFEFFQWLMWSMSYETNSMQTVSKPIFETVVETEHKTCQDHSIVEKTPLGWYTPAVSRQQPERKTGRNVSCGNGTLKRFAEYGLRFFLVLCYLHHFRASFSSARNSQLQAGVAISYDTPCSTWTRELARRCLFPLFWPCAAAGLLPCVI